MPIGLAIGQEHHPVRSGHHEGPRLGVVGRTAHGVEESIAVVVPFDDHDPVRALDVVAQSSCPAEGADLLRPGQQVHHQVAPEPAVSLLLRAQLGQLHGQYRGGVLEDHPFLRFAPPIVGVDEDQYPHDLVVDPSHGNEPPAITPRPVRRHRRPQQGLTPAGSLARVVLGGAWPGPSPQVPVAGLQWRWGSR